MRRASSMWRIMDFSTRKCCYPQWSITKKYLLKQKIKLLDNLACSPIENLSGLIVAKVYEGGSQYLF